MSIECGGLRMGGWARTMAFAARLGAVALCSHSCANSSLGTQLLPVETGSAPGAATANVLQMSTSENAFGFRWSALFSEAAEGKGAAADEGYCIEIRAGGRERWNAQLHYPGVAIRHGRRYTLQFRSWASRETDAYPKVGMSEPPYSEYFAKEITLRETPRVVRETFDIEVDDDPAAEFVMHLGGDLARGKTPLTICIDDVSLSEDTALPPQPAALLPPRPDVRVNQVGYLPGANKVATVVSASKEPLGWELVDATGATVITGNTVVFGEDAASGDHVHQLDFSRASQTGKGFVLRIGNRVSDPFDIESGVYRPLKYDSLAYFYHNRSGTPIEMPYAGGQRWTRPAGHRPDRARCTPQAVLEETGWKSAACDYTLDVSGGWYDGGDHGKYVVNGGIAIWTLLNLYERLTRLGMGADDFGDGRLNIPEAGNGVPDLLDEARWELEFLLRMQIPAGRPYAGMAHHKVHDDAWTPLPTAPHEDARTRYLRPPSTAATLNLAACAAQAARIFDAFDSSFADRLLAAAESAYAAAKRYPRLLAPEDGQNGGGPYDDAVVDDDFYWAAAELYITTSQAPYASDLRQSPHHTQLRGADGIDSIMTWQRTDGLGAISLSVADSALPEAEKQAQRARLVEVANRYLEAAAQGGYQPPFSPREARYPWGSNSFVLNNMLVLALAHDFTDDEKYFHGVTTGMDYLLGRNAMAQSYVTGYGERPVENPHHRFWARQLNDEFPAPPPGVLSGGPNSGLDDAYMKAAMRAKAGGGCRPQKCYADRIEAFSANEVTINWNAPLAWVAAWLDEQSR